MAIVGPVVEALKKVVGLYVLVSKCPLVPREQVAFVIAINFSAINGHR